MQVALIIASIIAVALLVLAVLARRRGDRLTVERDELSSQLESATAELATVRDELGTTSTELTSTRDALAGAESNGRELSAKVDDLAAQNVRLTGRVAELEGKVDEAAETLRKRTELADAQAEQIDALSGARDDLQAQLAAAEERIVTLAARPGVVVGQPGGDGTPDPSAATLWGLEVSRSERSWRNSVAIDPTGETSPFETTDDPVRTAVEIEAAALREDVGALITIDWKAEPVEAMARRLLVVRTAQELLAQASRAPGAARLIVTDGDEGSLVFTFESDDDSVVNLIPPAVDAELIAISGDGGLTVTVLAE